MINLWTVFSNSLWILGFSILLADLSYHYWKAGHEQRRLRELLGEPSFLAFLWLGLILVGAGLAATSQRWWEVVI